jgi:hypothetical protein
MLPPPSILVLTLPLLDTFTGIVPGRPPTTSKEYSRELDADALALAPARLGTKRE